MTCTDCGERKKWKSLSVRVCLRDGVLFDGVLCHACAAARADDDWFVLTILSPEAERCGR